MALTASELKWVVNDFDLRLHQYERDTLVASIKLRAWGDVRDMVSQYMDETCVDSVMEFIRANPRYFNVVME